MPTVDIGGTEYAVYADVATADAYLAADFTRAAIWDALTEDQKEMALVTATRVLQSLAWIDGVPSTEAPVITAVEQACAVFACDIATNPTLADSPSGGSNVKSVGAGSARVEFFGPTTGTPLPPAVFRLISSMLGSADTGDVALDNTAYGSEDWRRSRFDYTDYRLWPYP